METNKILHRQIMNIIDNQIRDEDPPETKQTLERLVEAGHSKTDAKKYIGQCIAVELFNVMNKQQPFDEKRYIKNLMNLPKEPFD